MAVLVFFLSFLFWEFFTPFNQFGEPVLLIGIELIFWATIAIVESFVIATVSEWKLDKRDNQTIFVYFTFLV